MSRMSERDSAAATAHRELRASEERYRALFEESRDAICIGTIDGQLLDVNPAAVKLFGYSDKQELLEKNIGRDLYWNPEDRRRTEVLFREQGFVEDHEVALKTCSGQRIRVQETASAIKDDNGEVVGFRGILRDVTDQRRLEHQLRQSQKMEAVGRLAGGIAHDFNNLLTVIMGHSERLQEHLAAGDPDRKTAAEILGAATRAANLTRQLLTLGRKQPAEIQVLDLSQVVRGLVPLAESLLGEDIQLALEIATARLLVRADRSQVEQVLVVVPRVPAALEAGPGPGAALAHPDQLAATDQHLAGAEAVEADEPRPRRRDQLALVDIDRAGADRCERRGEVPTEPDHRGMDVVGPPLAAGGQDHVDPGHLADGDEVVLGVGGCGVAVERPVDQVVIGRSESAARIGR